MAHLWISDLNEWKAQRLASDLFPLETGVPAESRGVMLRRSGTAPAIATWYLLAPPAVPVHVNGIHVALGICALRDKDEIRLAGAEPLFFSTEEMVEVEPFAGAAQSRCPRCTKILESRAPAVRCPGCGTWYHEETDRACFTYGENPICVACGADAVVGGGFAWSPEEL
ncbi:MAG: Prokaryotic finger family 1 [Verrucomicrobiota bacterium]|jgi:uncharacterized C2H2 Zn-finger protein